MGLTDFSISKKGFVKGKKVIEKIKEIVPERRIEEGEEATLEALKRISD